MEKETMELISKLVEIKSKYEMLVNYLLNNAELNYYKNKLRFNDCEDVIKALEEEKYNAKFNELNVETSEKNEDNHIPHIN